MGFLKRKRISNKKQNSESYLRNFCKGYLIQIVSKSKEETINFHKHKNSPKKFRLTLFVSLNFYNQQEDHPNLLRRLNINHKYQNREARMCFINSKR